MAETGSGLDALARACEERWLLFDCVPVVLSGVASVDG